jgi:hypothetical protein
LDSNHAHPAAALRQRRAFVLGPNLYDFPYALPIQRREGDAEQGL